MFGENRTAKSAKSWMFSAKIHFERMGTSLLVVYNYLHWVSMSTIHTVDVCVSFVCVGACVCMFVIAGPLLV